MSVETSSQPASHRVTPAAALRLAESIPETPENFPIVRELRKSLEALVALAEGVKA